MKNAAQKPVPRPVQRAVLFLCFAGSFFPLFADEGDDPVQAIRKILYEFDNYTTVRMSSEELNVRIALLLEAGADPNSYNRGHETFLKWAVKRGNAVLVKLLLDHGADPNMEDNLRQTVLETRGITVEIQKLLLESGADPNHRDYNGKSVLLNRLQLTWDWIGGGYGYDPHEEDLIAFTDLLEAGARPADADNDGNSVLLFLLDNSRQYPRLIPLKDLILLYVSDDEVKTAKAQLELNDEEKHKQNRKRIIDEKLGPSFGAVCFPLAFGGLGLLMREYVYKDDTSKNFMGAVNGGMLLCTGFMVAGLFIGADFGDNLEGRIGGGLLGGVIGTVAGIVIACLPPVRNAFNQYPVLYYTPAVLSAVYAGYKIYTIWQR